MEKITNAMELKYAIQKLEGDLTLKGQLLNEQFFVTYESLKPLNLLKSTMQDAISSSYLKDNILSTIVGVTSGYLSRKIVVGSSENVFKNLFGSFIQLGITNIVTQHPEAIKSMGNFVIQKLFSRNEKNSEKE